MYFGQKIVTCDYLIQESFQSWLNFLQFQNLIWYNPHPSAPVRLTQMVHAFELLTFPCCTMMLLVCTICLQQFLRD